jgi:LacI family transcriptional regulator
MSTALIRLPLRINIAIKSIFENRFYFPISLWSRRFLPAEYEDGHMNDRHDVEKTQDTVSPDDSAGGESVRGYGPRRRVSIQDVATACNVAPSTVSNALSGKRYVRKETRERIVAMAEKMGYRASTLARSLRLQRSWSIGLLLANISNPFYPEVARGVEDVAGAEAWNLILCNTDYQDAKQDRQLELLLDRQVDGLILASHPDERHIRFLENAGVPFVLLNKGHGRFKADYVGIDNRDGIMKAVDRLASFGHRRIAFICGHPESDAAEQRYEGYLSSLERLGIPFDPALVAEGTFDFASGQEAAEAFLGLSALPTAIVAASDLMALGAIEIIQLRGLRVPQDISVVGFDDILVASMPGIQLTTVRVPKWDLGATAARLLLKRVGGDVSDYPAEVIYPVELVERGTTASARGLPPIGHEAKW